MGTEQQAWATLYVVVLGRCMVIEASFELDRKILQTLRKVEGVEEASLHMNVLQIDLAPDVVYNAVAARCLDAVLGHQELRKADVTIQLANEREETNKDFTPERLALIVQQMTAP